MMQSTWTPPESLSEGDDDALSYSLDPENMLPRVLARRAIEHPERAFLAEVTGRELSYGQTWLKVEQWCTWLTGLGILRGDRVLTLLPSSIDATLAWLALGCIGAWEVPVNPDLRGSFLTHVLTDSQADFCLTRPRLAHLLSESAAPLKIVEVDYDDPRPTSAAPTPVSAFPGPANPACVIYTSGTTGPAKGAVLTWAQLASVVGRIPRSWLSDEDTAYSYHPTFHVTGRSPLLSMADCGGRVVFRERFSASQFWSDVRLHHCTTTTVQSALLMGVPEDPQDRDNPLRVAFGSHNAVLNARFADRFGVHLLMAYGSTEVGFPLLTRWAPSDTNRRWCGRLRRGYQARVVDESGSDLPDGQPGELWIEAPSRVLALREYLDRPDLTEKAFSESWYRTGDMVIRHPHGEFEFIDRLRDTIRRLGENISSSALEAVIDSDLEVEACAVVGEPDPVFGHRVVVVVTAKEGAEIDPPALHERLIERLPRYMLPSRIVVCDALPMTATNKVRKTNLLGSLSDGAVDWEAPTRR
jgi:crotonobetaine/carnitine-CoA ligase